MLPDPVAMWSSEPDMPEPGQLEWSPVIAVLPADLKTSLPCPQQGYRQLDWL